MGVSRTVYRDGQCSTMSFHGRKVKFNLPGFGNVYMSSILCFLAGSRVSTELHYTREKQGEESVFTSQMLIQTPKEEGTNILTQEALLVHMEAALSASKVQVSLFGKYVNISLCLYICHKCISSWF